MKEKLTQKDVEKIQQEIDHRKLVVRKEAIEAVKEARAQGAPVSSDYTEHNPTLPPRFRHQSPDQ